MKDLFDIANPNFDPSDRFGNYPKPRRRKNQIPGGLRDDQIRSQIPLEYWDGKLTLMENYTAWLLLEPMTVDQLREIMKVSTQTVRNYIYSLETKDIVRKFDWKDKRKTIYVRNTHASLDHQNRPIEINAKLFFFGDQAHTLIDYIRALGNPEANVHTAVKRITGLLSHVWVRSYYAKIGYRERILGPNPHESKKAFEIEIEKLQNLIRLMVQFRDSNIWTEEAQPTVALVSTAPPVVREFARIGAEWAELYNNGFYNPEDE